MDKERLNIGSLPPTIGFTVSKFKYNIKDMKLLAQSHSGKCLSDSYNGNKTKLLWQCSNDHIWSASPNSVLMGNWCRKCAAKERANKSRMSTSEIQKIAEIHGGICLDKNYINNKSHLLWQCSLGHQWMASVNSVKRGHWCSACAGNKKLSISDALKLAQQRGGKCLSSNYLNCEQSLLWQCSNNHVWKTTLHSIRGGSWCPYCNRNVGEDITRRCLEIIYSKKFIKVRPNWLVNDSGYTLELDGYCEDLKMAFEYQGRHHYDNNVFCKNGLKEIQDKDKLKKNICKSLGIKLIEIPYYISYDNIGNYLLKELNISNVDIIEHINNFDYKKINFSEVKLNIIKNLAKNKNGECLSRSYVNNKSKMLFKCFNGHEWNTTPSSIKLGHWCPTCAINKRKIQACI